jgi:hypothetical protein
LFSEVQDHTTIIPMSPLRKLELLIRPTPSQFSFNHFPRSTSFAYFLAEAKQTFTNFLKAHHKIENSRVMSSYLGGFTSKNNRCFTSVKHNPKCSRLKIASLVLTLLKSLNPTQESCTKDSSLKSQSTTYTQETNNNNNSTT